MSDIRDVYYKQSQLKVQGLQKFLVIISDWEGRLHDIKLESLNFEYLLKCDKFIQFVNEHIEVNEESYIFAEYAFVYNLSADRKEDLDGLIVGKKTVVGYLKLNEV